MSSNHLNIRTVWKSIASSVCVWLKFEHVFSTRWSPALKCSSPVWNAFISTNKCVHLQHNKCVSLLFGRWFKNSPPKSKKLGKFSAKLYFKEGWSWKGTETRHELKEPQKTTLHLTHNFGWCTCRYVVFFCFWSHALLLYFSRSIPPWNEILQELFRRLQYKGLWPMIGWYM